MSDVKKDIDAKAIGFGLIGFGEAGRAIAHSLLQQQPAISITAYDKLFDEGIATIETVNGVHFVDSPAECADASDIIFSVVTADEATNAVTSLMPYLKARHIIADGNSVSPGTKRHNARLIDTSGATYIDMAIMAPIHPRGHKTPLLLSGKEEEVIAPILQELDFSFAWEGTGIGDASIVKMLRSILIKGMECIITESVTASQELGLDTRILQSAGKTLGIADMEGLADYVMERAAVHGRRRAAEMREVAKTLDELGLSNEMASATARYQDLIADMNLADKFNADVPVDRQKLAPAMRTAQRNNESDI